MWVKTRDSHDNSIPCFGTTLSVSQEQLLQVKILITGCAQESGGHLHVSCYSAVDFAVQYNNLLYFKTLQPEHFVHAQEVEELIYCWKEGRLLLS